MKNKKKIKKKGKEKNTKIKKNIYINHNKTYLKKKVYDCQWLSLVSVV